MIPYIVGLAFVGLAFSLVFEQKSSAKKKGSESGR